MDANTEFRTPNAARHLAAMCKHFSHKVPVTLAGGTGQITLPFGRCTLSASDQALRVSVTGEDRDQLNKTIQVITSHLERFAFRENPSLSWSVPDRAAR